MKHKKTKPKRKELRPRDFSYVVEKSLDEKTGQPVIDVVMQFVVVSPDGEAHDLHMRMAAAHFMRFVRDATAEIIKQKQRSIIVAPGSALGH